MLSIFARDSEDAKVRARALARLRDGHGLGAAEPSSELENNEAEVAEEAITAAAEEAHAGPEILPPLMPEPEAEHFSALAAQENRPTVRDNPPSQGPGDPGGPEEIRSLRLLSGRIAEEPGAVTGEGSGQADSQDPIQQISRQMARHFAEAISGILNESRKETDHRSSQVLSNLTSITAETKNLGERFLSLKRDLDGVAASVQTAASGIARIGDLQRKVEESDKKIGETLKTQNETIEKAHNLVGAQTEAVAKQTFELQTLKQELKQQSELITRNASSTATETGQLKNRIEPLEENFRELSGQVDVLKNSVHEIEERFTALEKRLDAQAEAIKALHAAVQGFGARQEMIQNLLLKAQETNSVKPLPDSL